MRPIRFPQLIKSNSLFAFALLITGIAVSASSSLAATSLEKLDILTASGPVTFRVEVAQTSTSRAEGLMYVKKMPARQGMLFDFEREQLIMMWMKNTFLPLDMMFIGKDGRILKIVRNTKPLSLEVIESGVRVLSVLEVNGGMVDQLGVKRGDRVRHRIFKESH